MANIKTETLGSLSRTALRRKIKASGSQAALARTLGVSASTVRNWTLRLRKANQ
jgi:DNA-binding transcriptional regulator YiaG